MSLDQINSKIKGNKIRLNFINKVKFNEYKLKTELFNHLFSYIK